MKYSFVVGIFVVVELLVVASPAYCWDKYAHMVVCQIAYTRLTPKAKAAMGALIVELNRNPDVTGLGPDVQPYTPVTVGAWMDDLRGLDRRFSALHFIDLPLKADTKVDDVRAYDAAKGAPDNAYREIVKQCLPMLQNPTASSPDRAQMLGFLTHLVGDIHQPLHAAGQQRGGNDYKIDGLPAIDAGYRVSNLHAFWDNAYRFDTVNGKVTVVVASSDEPRPTSLDSGPLFDYASYLTAHYAKSQRKLVGRTDPAEWAAESARIAGSFVFPEGGARTLSPEYVHQAHEIACQRLVLAGYRLANVINGIFGK